MAEFPYCIVAQMANAINEKLSQLKTQETEAGHGRQGASQLQLPPRPIMVGQ